PSMLAPNAHRRMRVSVPGRVARRKQLRVLVRVDPVPEPPLCQSDRHRSVLRVHRQRDAAPPGRPDQPGRGRPADRAGEGGAALTLGTEPRHRAESGFDAGKDTATVLRTARAPARSLLVSSRYFFGSATRWR